MRARLGGQGGQGGQGRKTVQNQMLLVTKKVRQNTVVRIKSSLSTFPPCLPGPAQK
ncbi:MAG: hypothetical protein ACKPBB_06115 [Sphaerospermopsis kisseleviana]